LFYYIIKKTFQNKLMKIDSKTGILGLFGNPSRHSLSPIIQNFFLSEYGKNCVYLSFEPDSMNLKESFAGAKNLKFVGINVTMPFKEDVFNLVDTADSAASVFKAINTVKFLPEDNTAIGYSTDGSGVIKSLEDKNFSWKEKKCLVLGAGGAAKSAVYSILQTPVKEIFVFDILSGKSDRLFELFGRPEKLKTFKSLSGIEERLNEIDLIINCTPAGMDMGNNANINLPAVPDHWSLKDKFIFDMVYKPFKTKLIEKAKVDGAAEVVHGIEMLINQAAFSFNIWFGIMPEEKLIKEIKDKLVKSWI
jgi:shikimate dehydrogenase